MNITRHSDAKSANEQAATFMSGAGYLRIGKAAGVLRHDRVLALHFSAGPYQVHITAAAPDAAAYQSLLEGFGRTIAGRIAAAKSSN